MEDFKIIWSKQAVLAVKDIYNFFKGKSPKGAQNLKSELIQSPKTIRFLKQYQVDEINPKYRRIVVRDYKVLYTQQGNEIRVVDVVGTKQSPHLLESK